MKNKKWFSLLEVLLSVIILWMFIGTVITIYINIRWADSKMSNKRLLTSEASNLIDELHEAALDYTIDYEEYFNKSYNDNEFTSYWNEWSLYYCAQQNNNSNKYELRAISPEWWCVKPWNQKYLEYYFQHKEIKTPGQLNNENNKYEMIAWWPVAIIDNTGNDYIYLINWDWTERYYFRRAYKWSKEIDWQVGDEWINEKLFTVQVLKLKWYDAWIWHDYQTRWAYDWFIDTWACDKSQWYECHGNEWLQNWYKLPDGPNDWWIDLTSDKVTVRDMKIDIYPIKDPYIEAEDDTILIDPYAKISFTMNIYWKDSDDEITVSTTLWFKNSYRRFPIIEYDWYVPNF